MSDSRVPRVHIFDGITPSGSRVRAWCTCGYVTTPRADAERAVRALETVHHLQAPTCAVCRRDRSTPGLTGYQRHQDIREHLRMHTVDDTGEQFLACSDDLQACGAAYEQQAVHADRAVAEALGFDPPQPRLWVIR